MYVFLCDQQAHWMPDMEELLLNHNKVQSSAVDFLSFLYTVCFKMNEMITVGYI
jgi:hypothetical protein